jgi:hypothetical protein
VVDGTVVVDDGRLTTLDLPTLAEAGRAAGAALRARASLPPPAPSTAGRSIR